MDKRLAEVKKESLDAAEKIFDGSNRLMVVIERRHPPKKQQINILIAEKERRCSFLLTDE